MNDPARFGRLQETDVLPVGMGIVTFSLMTKLITDSITSGLRAVHQGLGGGFSNRMDVAAFITIGDKFQIHPNF